MRQDRRAPGPVPDDWAVREKEYREQVLRRSPFVDPDPAVAVALGPEGWGIGTFDSHHGYGPGPVAPSLDEALFWYLDGLLAVLRLDDPRLKGVTGQERVALEVEVVTEMFERIDPVWGARKRARPDLDIYTRLRNVPRPGRDTHPAPNGEPLG